MIKATDRNTSAVINNMLNGYFLSGIAPLFENKINTRSIVSYVPMEDVVEVFKTSVKPLVDMQAFVPVLLAAPVGVF